MCSPAPKARLSKWRQRVRLSHGARSDAIHPTLRPLSSCPSSCLDTRLSQKLCFAGADQPRALCSDAGPRKQSFQDKGVPKQELGHEGFIRTKNAPWHWAKALYLEWFSVRNGRVVIQTTRYTLDISPPAWTMTAEEYRLSREASAADYLAELEKMIGPLTGDARVIGLGELLAEQEREDDDEGEQRKKPET